MQFTSTTNASTNIDDIMNASLEHNDRSFSSSELSKSDYIYTILTAVTSGLSIVGGICICLLHFIFKDVRTPGRKLLLFLAISDAMLALGNLLGVVWYLYSDTQAINKSPVYCKFQSALTIYFSNTAFSWTVVMGTCLFFSTVLNNPAFTTTYMKLFHILTWIPPGIIVIVALSMNVLGIDPTLNEASWCWIDPRVPDVFVWQLVTGKLWEIIAYITTVVLYGCIKCFLAKKAHEHDKITTRRRSRKMIIREANRKLTFVPLVFIVCRIWGTLRFLLGNFAKDHINDPAITWINPLQGIGDSAQGIANFVLYCFSTETIRHRLVAMVCPSSFTEFVTETGMASQAKDLKKNKVGVTTDTETHARDGRKNKARVATETDIESPTKDTKLYKIGVASDKNILNQSGEVKKNKIKVAIKKDSSSRDAKKDTLGSHIEHDMGTQFSDVTKDKACVSEEIETGLKLKVENKNEVGLSATKVPVFLPSIYNKYEI